MGASSLTDVSPIEAWLIAILGGAAAALLATAIVTIIKKAGKAGSLARVGRVLKWPLTLRLTTSASQRKAVRELNEARATAEVYKRRFDEVCDALDITPVLADSTLAVERIERLQEALVDAAAHAKSQIEATRSRAASEAADAARITDGLVELARADGVSSGRAQALAEFEARRAVPLLRPTWRIDELGTADAFRLANTQHDVTVRNVSVEAATGDFQFASATQMRGDLEQPLEFRGQKTETGRRLGVDFLVKWQDANDEWWSQTVRVGREPRRAFVL